MPWKTYTFEKSKTFTSNDTFVVPSGVEELGFIIAGGGGGGGTGSGAGSGGAGGGGAQPIAGQIGVTSGDTLTITIGAAGAGGSGGAGGAGGQTTVTGTGVNLKANGAAGGAAGVTSGTASGAPEAMSPLRHQVMGGDATFPVSASLGNSSIYADGGGVGVQGSPNGGPGAGGGAGLADGGDGGDGTNSGTAQNGFAGGTSAGGGGGGGSGSGTGGFGGAGGPGVVKFFWVETE